MGTSSQRPTLRCLASTVGICVVLASDDISYAQGRQKEVLTLYSTRRDSQISVVGDREIPRILEQRLPGELDYYSEHLDQSRFSDPGYERAFHDFLRLKYEGRRFDVVIAIGEKALVFVDTYRTSLFRETPVVFFASDPATRAIANSTGVRAPLSLRGTIELALKLQPETRNVFVIAGSGSDASYARAAREQLRPLEPRLAFNYLTGLTTRDLESRLVTLPAHSIVYYLLVSRDGAGGDVHPLRYLDRVAAIAKGPTYSWVDSALGHGIVGGSLKSQEAEVSALAGLALRILQGEPAHSIPSLERDLNMMQVDWRQLRRWGISEGRVPAGTRIMFREPGFWERYQIYALSGAAIVLAQSLLIAALLVQRSRRRRAEAETRRSFAELQSRESRIRNLNRQLLTAREAERSSIARELHDELGPQMAALTVDLTLLTTGPEKKPEELTPVIRETLERTQQIAKALQSLSHRLHPALVHLIGLVAALEGIQRDFSRPGLSITFAHVDIPPALPQELTLSVFRVVQEALRNAVKHGNARAVSIQLSARGESLVLTIVDDGVGFDIDAAWGRGLGLISMTERLEQLGGSVTIHTQVGAGTRLEVIAPIRSSES